MLTVDNPPNPAPKFKQGDRVLASPPEGGEAHRRGFADKIGIVGRNPIFKSRSEWVYEILFEMESGDLEWRSMPEPWLSISQE